MALGGTLPSHTDNWLSYYQNTLDCPSLPSHPPSKPIHHLANVLRNETQLIPVPATLFPPENDSDRPAVSMGGNTLNVNCPTSSARGTEEVVVLASLAWALQDSETLPGNWMQALPS